jgi:predicted DCC family thiol-disulfide oxidoreductase YuxK
MSAILLIDGSCLLCNYWLQKVNQWDKHFNIKFASLQTYSSHLQKNGVMIDSSIDSVVFIQNQQVYYKSTAILKVFQSIGGWRKIACVFYIIPKFIRDFIYDYIAKNRYKWFGQKDNCLLPSAIDKSRFL